MKTVLAASKARIIVPSLLLIVTIFCLGLGLSLGPGIRASLAQDGGTATRAPLSIVFASDMPEISNPGRGGRLPELGGLLAELRGRGPVAFLLGGYSIGPSLLGSVDQGAHIIDLLTLLKPQAMALGQREFVYGTDVLRQRMAQAGFPFLSANVSVDAGQPPLEGLVASKVVEAGGWRIGVVGLTSPDVLEAYLVDDIVLKNVEDSLAAAVTGLKAQGVDATVLMVDFEPDNLTQLREANGIDVVLSNDSNDRKVEIDAQGALVRSRGTDMVPVVVLEPGDGKGVTVTARLEALTRHAPDPTVRAAMGAEVGKLKAMMGETLGRTKVPLDLTRAAVRGQENAFGNYVADALRARYAAEIALVNGGGLRSDRTYEPGSVVSVGDVHRMLPFNNFPTVIEVTGEQLRLALENGLSQIEDLGGRFPHTSNLSVTYDPAAEPGHRVQSIRVGGRPLKDPQRYSLATVDYLAAGGDGYDMFKDARRLVKPDTGMILWKLVAETIRSAGVMEPVVDGRLKIVISDLAGKRDGLTLNEAEKAWLADHPEISVGMMNNWPPLAFVDDNGAPQGVAADLIHALNARLDGRLKLVPGAWPDIYEQTKTGKMDMIMDITPRPDRQEFFDFSAPYLVIPHVFVAKETAPFIATEADLKGKILALERGFGNVKYFRTNFPDIRVVEYDGTAAALDAVVRGEADAYAGNRAVATYIMEKELMHDLAVHGRLNKKPTLLAIGSYKGSPLLGSIIAKALADIGETERRNILQTWVFGGVEQAQARTVQLSGEERAWLRDHPIIRVQNEADWAPFNFIDRGQPAGFSIDLMNLLARKVGLQVEYVSGRSWEEFMGMIRDGELDAMLNIVDTEQRRKWFLFTEPFVDNPPVVIARKDGEITSFEGLKGRTVCVPEGFFYHDVLLAKFPDIRVEPAKSQADCLRRVSAGQAEATIGSLAVQNHLIGAMFLNNIGMVAPITLPEFDNQLSIGVRKDLPVLHGILQKALTSVSDTEMGPIRQRWLAQSLSQSAGLNLTPEELAFLRQHSSYRLGIDPNWPPFEFLDENGKHAGISSGFVAAVAERLAVKMDVITDGRSWQDVLAGVKNGDIDVLPMIAKTPERETYLNFTKPYISFPAVVVTRQDAPYVGDLNDLIGKRVAVASGYVTEERLRNDYPTMILITPPDVAGVLQAVADGKADAGVANLAAVSHIVEQTGRTDVKVAAPTPYSYDLSMGVRKDWPELVSALDKTLNLVGPDETAQIKNRWVGVTVSFGLDWMTIIRWAAPIVVGGIAVIVVVVLWNRKLDAEIVERKAAQDALQDAYGVISDSIDYASRIQRSALTGSDLLAAVSDDHLVIWEPRDVVGGDIYWCHLWGEGLLVALADCTGHGVPGAFMTLIASGALDTAMGQVPPGEVGDLIQSLHQSVQMTLGQHEDQGESDDGLELGVCYLTPERDSLLFSGARFSLFAVEDGAVREIKGTKKGIGYRRIEHAQTYATERVPLKQGAAFYLVSDGYLDQVGGEKRRMFGKKRFKAMLEELHGQPFAVQKEHLQRALLDYQGAEARRDDVSVIGFKV